jgi:hypothetical protein
MSLSRDLDWKDPIDPYLDNITSLNDEPDMSPPEYRSKRARSASVSSVKPRKRASAQENAATTAAEGMNTLASSMVAPQLTRFDQCMEVLKEMESDDEITSTDLFRISRAIMKESEHYAALFFGLPTKLRLEWLQEENLLSMRL